MDWKAQLLNFVLTILGACITAVIPILVTYAIKRFNKAIEASNIQITAAQQEMLIEICDNAVAYAEEYYANLIKKNIQPAEGFSKLNVATEFAVGLMKEQKLPEMASDALSKFIEARLNMARDPTTPGVATLQKDQHPSA
jgi:hypothetical protein